MAAEDSVLCKIEEFLRTWPDAEWGPAHVVLSDYNLEDHWIDCCLGHIEAREWLEHRRAEMMATAAFLRELRAIPEDERCAELDEADDD